MNRRILICIIPLLFLITHLTYSQNKNYHTVFQSAPIISLMNGVMNDNFKIGDINKHGDFGLGTFNGVDGEMIVLNGITYQVKNNGKSVIPPQGEETPFVTVTFFKANKTIHLKDTLNFKNLTAFIDKNIPSKNLIYAIKISGDFNFVETRSEPKQTKEYSSLADVLKNQSVFKFRNTTGTIVGFRYPSYLEGVNVPGYHFHFLTEDKKEGGHVLNLITKNINIEIDYIRNINLRIPGSKEFYNSKFKMNTMD